MNTFEINPNNRPQPFLEQLPDLSSPLIQEITNAAIPILSLFPSVSPFVILTTGSFHISSQGYQLYSYISAGTLLEHSRECMYLCFTTANVALPILIPGIGSLPGQAYHLMLSLQASYNALSEQKHSEAARKLVDALSVILFSISLVSATPEWIFLSILTQAINEACHLQTKWENGKFIEAASHLILCLVRGHGAYAKGRVVYRNNFGEKIHSIKELKDLLT